MSMTFLSCKNRLIILINEQRNYSPPTNLQMNPLGPCLTIFTQNVPGVCDSSELQSTGTLRSGSNGQYTPQLSSYLD